MKLSISMTRRETLLGWSYLPINLLVLPVFLSVIGYGLNCSLAEINILLFSVNFVFTTVVFCRFLGESLQMANGNIKNCFKFAAIGFAIYYALSLLLSYGILWINPEFFNVNDETLGELAKEHKVLFAIGTILFVPVTEETLYRGLLFQSVQRKNRILAYLVSTVVFAFIHVFGYIGMYDGLTLTLCFVQYLPAGIALAWTYEKADNIIAPIIMHMFVNLISLSAMR